MVNGAEANRSAAVEAQAAAVPAAVGTPAQRKRAEVLLRQRAPLRRPLLTVLVLLCSVVVVGSVVWSAKVSAVDPVTKQAPASGVAPAGALSKTGQLPSGGVGEISGTVSAANDDAQPVGRVLVQAYRMGPRGLIAKSSTTTRADGGYTLAGLFPTGYYLKFSAAGYITRWYPNGSTQAMARHVTVMAQGVTADVNTEIAAHPASISGTVKSGRVLTTVTARPLLGPRTGQPVAAATTHGGYRLAGLPAPGAYELTFTASGYQESTLVDTVGAGEERQEPPVVLGASLGQISGIISDGTHPLGGASVRTMVNGTPLDLITARTGQVGAYTLTNLPTPATYVITYSSPGHGTISETVDLAAGQRRTGQNVSLSTGTGTGTGIDTGTGIGAGAGAQPLPPVDPAPYGAGETEAERIAVTFALAQLGKPYVFGAAGPNTYDCSGLTMAAWAAAGVTLPHYAAAQWHEGTRVLDPLLLTPGDLIFIPGADGTLNPPNPGHVGMYIGAGYVIEAPQTGDVVKIVPLSSFGPIIGMRHIA